MSASVVQFRDLRLKDEIYISTSVGDRSLHGTVTGIGPGRELILDGDRKVTAPKNSLLLVVNEDSE